MAKGSRPPSSSGRSSSKGGPAKGRSPKSAPSKPKAGSSSGQARSSSAKPASRPAAAAAGPDLPAILPFAGLLVALWASLPRYSGPRLNVAQSTEMVDHVFPAVVVLLASLAGIAVSRRAQGPGSVRFLGGLAVLLAGLWMMATHLPLVAQASRGDAPWPATIYHTSSALAVFGLGLLWASVTWSEANDSPKATAKAQQ